MATSLSEIANIKGDADLAQGGFGTDAILPENNTALAYLNHASDLQAGANRYLAEVHNQKLKDYMDNFHNIDLKNLAPGDYDPLSNDYVALSKDIADNYDVIQNPLKNRELAASLMARESSLRSRIAQSQMDRGMQDENNKFIQAHPDFNTPEYQKNVSDFWQAPLGQRKPFALNPAYVFHPADIAKVAYDQVKQKYATATTDGKYIFTQDGLKAAAPAYLQAYNTLLNSDDQYGRTARAAMMNAWNQLPADQKAQFGNNPQKWSDTQALALMSPDQQEKAGMTTNEFATIKAQGAQARQTDRQQNAFNADQNDKNRENALLIAGLKGEGTKGNKFDKNAVGGYVHQIYNNMINGKKADVWDPAHPFDAPNTSDPNVPNEVLQPLYGDDKKIKHTTKNIEGTDVTTEDLPTISVIGSRMANDGKVLIERRDNRTGRILPPMYRDPKDFFTDLNNILGPKSAPQVAQAAKDYAAKNGSGAPATPSQESYTTGDGKTYSHQQLKGFGYTDDQIKQYLDSGVLK